MLPWSQELSDLPDSWELLDRALQLAPDDAFIIELRAAMRLNHIDFDCHHLPDTLLGPVVYVMDEITQLRALAMRSAMDRQTFYLEQARHYEAQVHDFARANPNFDSAWKLLK